MLLLTDAAGSPAGRILYDAYGGVLIQELTPALETALSGQGALVDPDTDLVHLGGGRYYDPAMGRPLQPNPVGVPPTVPQALNRYAATPLGQPGVAEGVNNPSFTNIALATGFIKSAAFETAARSTFGFLGRPVITKITSEFISTELSIQASKTAFTRAQKQIIKAGGSLVGDTTDVVINGRNFIQGLFRANNLEAASKLPDILNELPTRLPWRAEVEGISRIKFVPKEIGTEPRFSILKHPVTGFGTDAALSFGFQYYEDSFNPHFTPGQRFVRAGTSAVGSAGTALLFVSLACGPEAPVCAVTMATLGGISWSYLAQPPIFESIPYLQAPPRNLQPLK